ncbi:MAG: T9SS type A sorting domain-containing protein [bacterium]
MRSAILAVLICILVTPNISATVFVDEAGNIQEFGQSEDRVLLMGEALAGALPSSPLWEVVVDTTGSMTRLYVCAGQAFASRHGGVFVSENGGVDWDSLSGSFANDFVLSLALDESSPGILLAGTDGDGIYRTTDAGVSWLQVLGGQKTRHIVFDETQPSVVYCGNEGTGFFKSTDAGMSWHAHNAGMSLVNTVGVAVDPSDSNHVYAIWQALNSGGVYYTSDGGLSWVPVPDLPSQRQTGVAVDPTDGNIVYVCNSGPWNAGMDDGVYKSTDGGINWSNNWTFSDTAELHSVAVAPSDPNIIFAGGNKWLQPFGTRIWKSTDAGATWSLVYDNPAKQFVDVGTIAVNPLNPMVAYAGARANGSTIIGVLKTTDGGATWNEVNTGLTNLSIMSLAIDPTDTTRVLAATAGGVFITNDCGANWSPTDSLGYSRSVAVRSDSIIYAGTLSDGVFRSTDSGASWSPFNDGISVLRTINDLAVDPSHPYRVFAALSNVGVYAVVDTGFGTWTAIGPFGGDVNCIAVVSSDNQIIYAGTQAGVYKSTDGGAFWEQCPGSPAGAVDVVKASWSGDTVYAGGMGYFRSVDGGFAWGEIPLPTAPYEAVKALAIDPYAPLVMYLGLGSYLSGTYCHVLKSTDGGGTWEFKCGGLPFSNTMAVSSIGINRMNTLRLYATFGSGFFGTTDFYVSLDGGEIWTHPVGVEEDNEGFTLQGATFLGNEPNPFERWTMITYSLPGSGHTTLKVYDTTGRVVETLVEGREESGIHRVKWKPEDEPSGVYFVRLLARNVKAVSKVMLVR